MEVIQRGLKAMDATALTICMENNIPIIAFGLSEEDAIMRVVSGDTLGTVIS